MKNLMLMSTHTGAGKHTLACGILHSLRRQSVSASPFKSVSIEAHTCVLPDGSEISFAQALQAVAAGKTPRVEMNPYVALYGEHFALIELGKRMTTRPHMVRERQHYLTTIEKAFRSVAAEAQLVVIEGSGSPVELGLEDVDLANVSTAVMADAKVLLITEMIYGGGYAHVVGTWQLLPEDIRERVVGIVLNKFDLEEPVDFADKGVKRLSELLNRKVMVVPFFADTYVPGDAAKNPINYNRLNEYLSGLDGLADVIDRRLDMDYLRCVLDIM
jgi:adenosylcobyric acid synthase